MTSAPISRLYPALLAMLLSVLLGSSANAQTEEALGYEVAMRQSGGGTLYLEASVGGVAADFLLDTGAGLVTVNRDLFNQIKAKTGAVHVREMGARLASGRIKIVDIYRVQQFSIGSCELGSVEIAVMEGKGRNLLGLNALKAAAPFSVGLSPPAMTLSNCGSTSIAAAY